MKPNPEFVSQVKEVAKPTDTILVMCRSGGRSAKAVNRLAEAGFRTPTASSTGWRGMSLMIPAASFTGKDEERLEELGVAVDLRP